MTTAERPTRRGRPMSDHQYLLHLIDSNQLAGQVVHLRHAPTPQVWALLDNRRGDALPVALVWFDPWTGAPLTLHRCAECHRCGRTTWNSEDGEDPRGPVGLRVAEELRASDYGTTGPDVPACWDCHSNDGVKRGALERLARRFWTPTTTPNPTPAALPLEG